MSLERGDKREARFPILVLLSAFNNTLHRVQLSY